MASETQPKLIWEINRYGERSLSADDYIKQKEANSTQAVTVQSEYVSQRTGGSRSRPLQPDFVEASPRLRVLRRRG